MNTSDPRANDLLSRVSEDISLLRQDIGNLFTHARRHTLPEAARGISDTARQRLLTGREFTTEQLRALRSQIQQPATAWVGGAVLVGLLAAGVYWFLKSDCCRHEDVADEDI
jgi:hypothetical protein